VSFRECEVCGGTGLEGKDFSPCLNCKGEQVVEYARRFAIYKPTPEEQERIAWVEMEYDRQSKEQARKALDEEIEA